MNRRPRAKSPFKVGDQVFYPSAGVGIIDAIEDVYLTGQRERCYVIRIFETGVTIKVPRTNMAKNGIRPLLEGRKVKDLYKVLSAAGKGRAAAGKLTERCRDLARKVNTGTCIELGEAVRDLMRWKQQSGLSFEEVRLLQTASNHLAREIATVAGISPEAAFDKIREHVEISA